uniref:Amidinotransferase n=1 Tax=Acrobeloides nanus TaxID=290746 RepID=A0A914BX56_9BILA
MCKPTYYRVEYSINPWMNPSENPVDRTLAMYQWNSLRLAIETAGAIIDVMEPHGGEHLPDMVFAANAAIIRGKKAYLANFQCVERKNERHFYKKWLQAHGYETFGSMDYAFEGEGDARWVGRNQSKLVCGVGARTDARIISDLKDKMKTDSQDFKAIALKLVDPRFYHLETCFCPLAEDLALWYPDAFDSVAQHNLKQEMEMVPAIALKLVDPRFYHLETCFCPLAEDLALWYPDAFDSVAQHNLKQEMEMVPISEADATKFACDAVVVGKNVILNKGADDTGKTLQRLGFIPNFVDLSEFIKGGGSSKNLALTLTM